MAARHWVGGSATWNGTAGTKWSLTAGGTGNQAIPTNADDVFFDASSGAVTITIGASAVCMSLNCTGFTGTMAGTSNLSVGGASTGHVTFVAGMSVTWTGTLNLVSTTTGNQVTFAGKALDSVNFNGTAGAWQLQDTVNVTNAFTGTKGAMDFNAKTLNLGSLVSSGTAARTFTLTNCAINLSGAGLTFGTLTGITLTTTGSTVTATGAACTIDGGATTWGAFVYTGTGSSSWNSANTWTSALINHTSGTLTTASTKTITGAVDFTGCTGTYAGSAQLTMGSGTAADFTAVSGMTWTSTGLLNFISTTTGNKITTGGRIVQSMSFNGASGAWTFQDNVTGNGTLTLTQGTLNTNTKTVQFAIFTSTANNTRVLTITSSGLTFTSAAGAPWTLGGTGLTFNSTGSTITLSGAGATFDSGAFTYGSVVMSGGGTMITKGAFTATNFTCTGTAVKTDALKVAAGFTVSTLFTLSGNSQANRLLIQPSAVTYGTSITITSNGTNTISYTDFRDIVGAGTASWNIASATGGSGDCGGNSGMTLTTPANQFWKSGTGNFSDSTKWFTTSGGSTPGRVPLPQDTTKLDSASFTAGSQTVTQDMPRMGGIDFTGATNSPTFASSLNFESYGSITFISAMSLSGTNTFNLSDRGAQTFTTGTLTIPYPLTCQMVGGSMTFADNYNGTGAITYSANITTNGAGVITATTQNVTVPSFTLALGSVNMGSGTWTMSGTGTVWNTNVVSGTGILTISDTSATSKLLQDASTDGTKPVGIITIPSGTGTVTIGLSADTLNLTGPLTINGATGATWTYNNFNATGSAAHVITITRVGLAGNFTTSKSSGIVSCDYLSLSFCAATGGASWYAGANSTDGGSNSGWVFTAPPTPGGTNSGFFTMM